MKYTFDKETKTHTVTLTDEEQAAIDANRIDVADWLGQHMSNFQRAASRIQIQDLNDRIESLDPKIRKALIPDLIVSVDAAKSEALATEKIDE